MESFVRCGSWLGVVSAGLSHISQGTEVEGSPASPGREVGVVTVARTSEGV